MQGKSVILATSFVKLITAFILLPTAFIKFTTATIIRKSAKIKLSTAFYILSTALIILSTATIKLLTANNILASVKLLFAGAEINRKQFATAQEKAHLQSAPPNAKPKIAKELFPFPLLPTLKKKTNFLHYNPKNQPIRIDGTAYNKSFARLRGKVLNSSLFSIFELWCLTESFDILSPQPRKAPNRCTEIPSGFPYNEQGFAPARSPSGLRTTWILHKAKPCAKPSSLQATFSENYA